MTDYASLVTRITEAVRAFVETASTPYALFGHSLGALLAFGVAHQLRHLPILQPSGLVIAAASPPPYARGHIVDPPVKTWTLTELRSYLLKQGGTSQEVLDSPVLLGKLFPRIQADIAILASYFYTEDDPLDCPIAVFGGEDDEHNPPRQLEQWKEYTRSSCTVHLLPGNHFFLLDPALRLLFFQKLRESIQWLDRVSGEGTYVANS
jgi:medium-chain acyl-[acyl-carrier-protein] hydrolase